MSVTRVDDHVWRSGIRDIRTADQQKADRVLGSETSIARQIEDVENDLHFLADYLMELREREGRHSKAICPACWQGTLERWPRPRLVELREGN